jgi:hypothetical protein
MRIGYITHHTDGSDGDIEIKSSSSHGFAGETKRSFQDVDHAGSEQPDVAFAFGQ